MHYRISVLSLLGLALVAPVQAGGTPHAASTSFDFQIDTIEAKRALEVCNNELEITFTLPSTLRFVCDGAIKKIENISSAKAPLFDSVSTLNKSVLVASQDVSLMKTTSPSMLRTYYNGLIAEYTEEYLVDLSEQIKNMKLWADYA